jgi:hypothetical protein
MISIDMHSKRFLLVLMLLAFHVVSGTAFSPLRSVSRTSPSSYSTIPALLEIRGGDGRKPKKSKADEIKIAEQKKLVNRLTRIGIEAVVGILLILIGESREIIWLVALGAVSMGAVLAEITAFLGEDALKMFGAAIGMMAILLLLQL